MPGSILGNIVRRVEDPALLRGEGEYVDNLRIDGVLSAVFVRSPLPHATITGIDADEARQAPGVVAVFTAADLELPAFSTFGALNKACARPPLATDRVRFVGDAVAVVVAETLAQAEDAASLVDIDYDPLPAVTDPEQALAPDAPRQFDALESNVAAGFRDEGDDPLAGADVVVSARIENQRVAVVPMEGNAIAAIPGNEDGDYDLTVYVSTQMPHGFHDSVTKLLGLERDRVRVITPHVGGGFGGKAGVVAEHAVVVAAAGKLARPVKWVESRSENMIGMPHGRGQVQFARLGLRRDGTIVGLRAQIIGDAGAYGGFGGGLAMGPTYLMVQGVYRIPKLGYDALGVLTNTTPMGAFRGAGRPEAAAMLERLMDLGAAELGIDPVEIRRRNFVTPEEFPFDTLSGMTYDSGDYELPLNEVLRVADYDGLRVEQRRRIDAGDRKLLGIGLSTYVEITGGGAGEFGAVEVHDDGSATIRVGTSAHGQGHATAFAMVVSDRLGIPVESIHFVQSDTAKVPRGGGTGGSRSLQLGGNAAGKAAEEVLQRARKLAAELLEASEEDIEVDYEAAGLGISGVPGTVLSWPRLAEAARENGEPLLAETDFSQDSPTFPFGAHLSVVEVDVDTGEVRPVSHYAVDDCGNIVNPLLVAGQQHGGMAQGIAQALWEATATTRTETRPRRALPSTPFPAPRT